MKLTNEQQIEVLESVLKTYVDSVFVEWGGMCFRTLYELSKRGYCNYRETTYCEIRLFIPLLTIENAVMFGADTNAHAYWWPLSDIKSRARFLKWMIKQLKNSKDETTNS